MITYNDPSAPRGIRYEIQNVRVTVSNLFVDQFARPEDRSLPAFYLVGGVIIWSFSALFAKDIYFSFFFQNEKQIFFT